MSKYANATNASIRPFGLDDSKALKDKGKTDKSVKICKSEWARTHSLFNEQTGEIREINCKSPRCPKHAGNWLHKWKVVVAYEVERNPVDKFITLTCAGKATNEQLHRAKQLFFRDLRKYNGSIEYLGVLEFTTRTRLPHIHFLARSVFIEQELLSVLWKRATKAAGIKPSFIVDIRAPNSQTATALYILSYALNGEEKNQGIPDTYRGRKISYSKGFFTQGSVAEIWQKYCKELSEQSGRMDTGKFVVANFTSPIDVSRETGYISSVSVDLTV